MVCPSCRKTIPTMERLTISATPAIGLLITSLLRISAKIRSVMLNIQIDPTPFNKAKTRPKIAAPNEPVAGPSGMTEVSLFVGFKFMYLSRLSRVGAPTTFSFEKNKWVKGEGVDALGRSICPSFELVERCFGAVCPSRLSGSYCRACLSPRRAPPILWPNSEAFLPTWYVRLKAIG